MDVLTSVKELELDD